MTFPSASGAAWVGTAFAISSIPFIPCTSHAFSEPSALSVSIIARKRCTLGVDVGKSTWHVVALDNRGAVVGRERLSRAQVQVRFANQSP